MAVLGRASGGTSVSTRHQPQSGQYQDAITEDQARPSHSGAQREHDQTTDHRDNAAQYFEPVNSRSSRHDAPLTRTHRPRRRGVTSHIGRPQHPPDPSLAQESFVPSRWTGRHISRRRAARRKGARSCSNPGAGTDESPSPQSPSLNPRVSPEAHDQPMRNKTPGIDANAGRRCDGWRAPSGGAGREPWQTSPSDDVLRAVAAMSSHGEWVSARDLAIALHLPKATVAVVLDIAVRDHLLDAEHDSTGIAWGRGRVRVSHGDLTRGTDD